MYQPKFTITPEINNQIARVEGIRQKIALAHILPTQEIALRYKAAIESVHSSTSIEGNPLTPREVQCALEGKMNSWEKRVIEVTNYKKAWDWVVKRSKKPKTITISDILHLHSLVMADLLPPEKIGYIRPGNIYIVDIVGKKEIVKYQGPRSASVSKLLSNLILWIKKNAQVLHPILLSGIVHYEFVSIHPFSDGNGRVTRLLVKLLLDSLGYDFRGSLVLDTYYWQNTSLYYQALNQAQKYSLQTKANLTPWLSYYVNGFLLVAEDLNRKINLISSLGTLSTIRLSESEIELLDYAHQFGSVDLQTALTIVQKPLRSVQRLLQKLTHAKLLTRVEQGKNTYYQSK